jgi:hypothetical protein
MKTMIIFSMLVTHGVIWGQSKPPSHEIFSQLLKENVTADGRVRYKDLVKDTKLLDRYLALLSRHPPDERTWTKNEQMAYWINAYNAFTIQLIVSHYPVQSIKEIGSEVQIPFVNTPWDIKFITISETKMDLNDIEHGRLRKKFGDPRIHMALVCASKSCPALLNEAYDPVQLDAQLNRQTRAFLADPIRNKISSGNAVLSRIFEWYAMDFSRNGSSVRDFINNYSDVKIGSGTRITYLEYDWGLNEP